MIAFFRHQTVRRPNVRQYINSADLQGGASAMNTLAASLAAVSNQPCSPELTFVFYGENLEGFF